MAVRNKENLVSLNSYTKLEVIKGERGTWILRKSGDLCWPLAMSTGTSWNSTSFSNRHARTLDTAVDSGGPYTVTPAIFLFGARIL